LGAGTGLLTGIESRDNVRVLQSSNGLNFAEEPVEGFAVVIGRNEKSFDGNCLTQAVMLAAEDVAHATAADLFEQPVIAEGEPISLARADAAKLIGREQVAPEQAGQEGVIVWSLRDPISTLGR